MSFTSVCGKLDKSAERVFFLEMHKNGNNANIWAFACKTETSGSLYSHVLLIPAKV